MNSVTLSKLNMDIILSWWLDKKDAKEAVLDDHKAEIKDKLFEQKLQTEYPTWLQEKKEKYEIKNTL